MFLVSDGVAPLVLGADENLTYGDVARQAHALHQTLRSLGTTRVMVASDRPSRLLTAVIATDLASADLWIVSGKLPTEKLQAVVNEFGIGLLLKDTSQELLKCEQGASTGRICLMTSGTTGIPKIVAHKLEALVSRRTRAAANESPVPAARWLLTYQPTSFAGLQVILAAATTGAAIVTAANRTSLDWFNASRKYDVTHISGTPTFWRGFLMVAKRDSLTGLKQATLGGEIIDQATLDRLHHTFPAARITHIYASTEAGVVFSVNDASSGFPKTWLDAPTYNIEMRIRNEILEVRTPLAMVGYLSSHTARISDDGWLSTGDRVQISGDRVQFLGREDSAINVGGSKVDPHVVEALLLGHDEVIDCRVFGCANPITGFIVGAEVVLAGKTVDKNLVRADLLRLCRSRLPEYCVPRILRFVDSIPISESGKKESIR